MARPALPASIRTALPYAAGVALLILAWFALQSLADREEETRRAMLDELHDRLADRVNVFERGLLGELDEMLSEASVPSADHEALQSVWRRTHPWFDALYVWRTTEAPTSGPEAVFVFPMPSAGASMGRVRCVRRAREEAKEVALVSTPPDAVWLAGKMLSGCAEERRAVRAYAAIEAAQLLRESGRPHEALDALALPDLDDRAPLRDTPDVGAAWRMSRRLLQADLLDELAQADRATRVRLDTLVEVLGLDAPDLEATFVFVDDVLERLTADGRDTRFLSSQLTAAEQRLAAYREIRQTAARRSGSAVSEGARFTWDQYSDTPYLLYSLRSDDGTSGVALQLRQDALLDAFLSAGSRFTDQIVITDMSGREVAGAVGVDPSEVVVGFRDTLRHLRAVLTVSAVSDRIDTGGHVTTIAIAMVTTFCIVLGLIAIYLQAKANERHQLLLQRQADFTARVTHELKTPLAGIKVMAENLSLGAFKDEAQRAMMADRIVDEADRLTSRVNEILNTSRAREIPDPEPFDVEEILLDLIEVWGPRYEQAGVRLEADMEPVDTVLGEPVAMRDAIACLLDNAMKYRREDIVSRVWLNVREDGRFAEIEVLDNGLGVPPALREAVFERFVRVEGDNRGKSGGHGLGLAQVAQIVAAHRGTVRCEEGVDGGARFVVRLPVHAS